jgi:23S rRNA (cytosine1962-C5)-methyltransferase
MQKNEIRTLAQNGSLALQKLTPKWEEYELLDTGGRRKLERFGNVKLVRPEAQATWSARLPMRRWEEANGEFVKPKSDENGEWKFRRVVPPRWEMRRGKLRFWVQPAPSGHVGVFPDQASHWDWIAEAIGRAGRALKMLSLFGHTGLATLTAAAAGAEVTHVDASRQALEAARENQALSGLSTRPVRWIVEDAFTFVRREARRGNRYDAMLIDPPRFGRGPNGQIWKLAESLPELLLACKEVLSKPAAFVVLNVYVTVVTQGRVEQEAQRMANWVREMVPQMKISTGELGLEDLGGRRISASVYARGVAL